VQKQASRILEVRDLRISFSSRGIAKEAVRGISFSLGEDRTLAIVGESGSGKTVSALALTRLLPDPPVCRVSGEILYRGTDFLRMPEKKIRPYRGKEIAYIFQEPSTSLNPVYSIGYQIGEAIRQHLPQVEDVKQRVIESLARVGIRDPGLRIGDYPHQLSGGMQQRVMIAMALACEPRLLIADEPTTALDVTTQAQIMDLLKQLRDELHMAVILITHNFGIVADFADDVAVMFRGEIVESGPTDRILAQPEHPYTKALIGCIPQVGRKRRRLTTIDYASL
jgi:ABC-type dipeptide/oligopeptide/nickel transport system ATPase component